MSDTNTTSQAPRVSSRLSNSAKLSNSISRRVHREIRFGDYVLGSTLGQGEFGKVKLGWRKDGKQPEQVAIKLIRKDTVPPKSNRETKVFREINALKILSHPNIVHLEQVIQNDKYIGIVLEYASGGELFDHILTHRYLKDSVACRLFAQLVSGVYYLHSKGIVHRDLKLENLLLDKHKNIIITDFGFANSFKASSDGSIFDLMSTSCGSPCYAAPELVVSDSKYVGQKVDVWSCGVILYAMLAGYLPFDDDPANPDGDNITQLYKYITTTPLTFPEYIQPMPRDLLRKILVPNPDKRVDLATVRAHSWLSPHAHFLSVTPIEWDQSYLSSQTKPQMQQQQQQGSQVQLARSQSVQVKSTTTNPEFQQQQQQLPSSSSSSSTPRYTPNPYHASSNHGRTNSMVSTPTTANPTPPFGMLPPTPPQDYPQQQQQQNPNAAAQAVNASYHSRRHSIQAGYTKGMSQSKSRVDRTEEVVKSLDIPEYTTSSGSRSANPSPAPTTSTTNQANSNIAPISENSQSAKSPYDTIGVGSSKTARLPPNTRKPRPTSFQPTSGGGFTGFMHDSSLPSPIDKEEDMFRVPMSAEPRVGLNHDSGLPGEMSKPSSFKSNSSTAALTKIGSQEQERERSNSTAGDYTVDTTSNDKENVTPSTENKSSTAADQKNVATTDSNNATTTDTNNQTVNSTASSNTQQSSPKSQTKTHRRAAASISYGADKLFSKILGSSSPRSNSVKEQRRHSMIPTSTTTTARDGTRKPSQASMGPSYKSTTVTSTERKRFSLMNFDSTSTAASAAPPPQSTASRSNTYRSKTSQTLQQSSAAHEEENRNVLKPPAGSSLNRRATSSATNQNTSSASSTPTKNPTKISVADKTTDSQSTARRVVEFFKRRSRMV